MDYVSGVWHALTGLKTTILYDSAQAKRPLARIDIRDLDWSRFGLAVKPSSAESRHAQPPRHTLNHLACTRWTTSDMHIPH